MDILRAKSRAAGIAERRRRFKATRSLEPGKLAEAAFAMLLTVGAVGAILIVLLCGVLGLPWPVGITVLLVAWALFTWDFYTAQLEAPERPKRPDGG